MDLTWCDKQPRFRVPSVFLPNFTSRSMVLIPTAAYSFILQLQSVRSDQMRSDQRVQDKAAETVKSRFLNRECEIPPCFDKIPIWNNLSTSNIILGLRAIFLGVGYQKKDSLNASLLIPSLAELLVCHQCYIGWQITFVFIYFLYISVRLL